MKSLKDFTDPSFRLFLSPCLSSSSSPDQPLLSLPRGNPILALGGSCAWRETHSELWSDSGPVSSGVLPICNFAIVRCLDASHPQFDFVLWILSPLSVANTLPYVHLLTGTPLSGALFRIGSPLEARSVIVESVDGPSFSPSFRLGPWIHFDIF